MGMPCLATSLQRSIPLPMIQDASQPTGYKAIFARNLEGVKICNATQPDENIKGVVKMMNGAYQLEVQDDTTHVIADCVVNTRNFQVCSPQKAFS